MSLTIQEKAVTIATFRFVHERLMEILSGWVPTTPEMDTKILFGRHIWHIAQHADALGKRTYELRKPLHYSHRPTDNYLRALAELNALQHPVERLYGFYELVLPGVLTRYRLYLEQTDRLLDAPTVRILARFLEDGLCMQRDSRELRVRLSRLEPDDMQQLSRLTSLEAADQSIVNQREVDTFAAESHRSSPLPFKTMQVHGITLRQDPSREPCFSIVSTDAEMHEYPGMSPISRRERLHRHMNNEVGSLEIAAQCLADFPAAAWDLRLQLARQCWDETRHIRLLYRRLLAIGGRKGEFPIANFEWRITCMLDSLPARLAVQNRTFEAGEMDLLRKLAGTWREAGDEQTAEILEGILADEIQHVRFANQWIKRMVQEDRRVVLQIAMAMRFLAHVTTALAPQAGNVNAVGTVFADPRERVPAVNVEDRQQAEFTAAEIQEILRQAGFRSLAERPETQ